MFVNQQIRHRDGMVDEVVQHMFNRRLGRTGKSNIQRKKWLKNFLELRDTNARTIMNPQWDDSTNWYIHLIVFYSAIKMGKLYLTV